MSSGRRQSSFYIPQCTFVSQGWDSSETSPQTIIDIYHPLPSLSSVYANISSTVVIQTLLFRSIWARQGTPFGHFLAGSIPQCHESEG